MDRLPDELVFLTLSFLEIKDIVRLQQVSTRFLTLGRDSTLWKTLCFNDSRAESVRRRQQLLDGQDSRLTALRSAVSAFPGQFPPGLDLDALQRDIGQLQEAARDPEYIQRSRALANWEPDYPGEQIDYFEEYVQRHAEISTGWLDLPQTDSTDKEEIREATGAALLCRDDLNDRHVVAPLDDGSIAVYDLSPDRSLERLVGHSRPGLLTSGAHSQTKRHALMTDTGAVESVSINRNNNHAYFAIATVLHEVDLANLSLVSSKQYPFPITALSSCSIDAPLVIGTNNTLHIYDARDSTMASTSRKNSNGTGELIAGPAQASERYVSLSQPGPLSILHPPGSSDSIWVAGRFTSLLQYSLRSFPRLLSTVHSGARISSLALLPYPLIPRHLDLTRHPEVSISDRIAAKAGTDWTAIAAGEYKGKGSLELYSMPSTSTSSSPLLGGERYTNRQTASASKLLSVAPHGGRLVHSDGDGNLRWVERDGVSLVRQYNINDAAPRPALSPAASPHQPAEPAPQGIWSASAPGQNDIVQKILPLPSCAASPSGPRASEQLLLWTGDGRLGVPGFGPGDPLLGEERFHDAVEGLQEQQGRQAVESIEESARRDAERQYGLAMRRALERSADEVRFVRGLGMGFMRG